MQGWGGEGWGMGGWGQVGTLLHIKEKSLVYARKVPVIPSVIKQEEEPGKSAKRMVSEVGCSALVLSYILWLWSLPK